MSVCQYRLQLYTILTRWMCCLYLIQPYTVYYMFAISMYTYMMPGCNTHHIPKPMTMNRIVYQPGSSRHKRCYSPNCHKMYHNPTDHRS